MKHESNMFTTLAQVMSAIGQEAHKEEYDDECYDDDETFTASLNKIDDIAQVMQRDDVEVSIDSSLPSTSNS